MKTEKLTQKQWSMIEEAIRATFGIKGLFYSDFSTYDAGVEFAAMIGELDTGTRSLSVSHTMCGKQKLVILSTCSFNDQAAADIGAFLNADATGDDQLFEVRSDVLDRLKDAHRGIIHAESVLKPKHQKGKPWPKE